jgi:hypothetical protein
MQKVMQGLFSLFKRKSPLRRGSKRKTRGQSLVEVAIAFPVLIMLFTGVVEFGFILNYYLSLLDATRESARYWSNADPFLAGGTLSNDEVYKQAAILVRTALDPAYEPATNTFNPSYHGRRIMLDPDADDVIVSIYGANSTGSVLWRSAGPYHLFPTAGSTTGHYPSMFNATMIQAARRANSPNAGVLLVEVHYNYHHVLMLPWMTAWLPNPLHLQAYTIMPMRAAEPQ